MSIQGIQNHVAYLSPQPIQKQAPAAVPAAPVAQDDRPASSSARPAYPAYDEYIPEQKHEPAGIYRIVHDEEGNPRIHFDDPMKADENSPKAAEQPAKEAAPAPDEPGRKAETCTVNTDKVDREIERLKAEREQLAQQVRAAKDPDTAEDLKRQLAQLENELRQKDNDAYRRQNAVFFNK